MSDEPAQALGNFFKTFMNNRCDLCWKMFSKKTQEFFLKWTLDDIYQQHPNAAKGAELGTPEVKLMFEMNDPSLMKSFWKRFYQKSGTNEIYRFGYYETQKTEGGTATVRITLKYPDGRRAQADVQMVKEGSWKFAYVESKLPFA